MPKVPPSATNQFHERKETRGAAPSGQAALDGGKVKKVKEGREGRKWGFHEDLVTIYMYVCVCVWMYIRADNARRRDHSMPW